LIPVETDPIELEANDMTLETFAAPREPNLAERAMDTATDTSRSITELSESLQAAARKLTDALAASRQPGTELSTISAVTREAPLASLFVAFLFGIAVARPR
jgi:hypothetical protein